MENCYKRPIWRFIADRERTSVEFSLTLLYINDICTSFRSLCDYRIYYTRFAIKSSRNNYYIGKLLLSIGVYKDDGKIVPRKQTRRIRGKTSKITTLIQRRIKKR